MSKQQEQTPKKAPEKQEPSAAPKPAESPYVSEEEKRELEQRTEEKKEAVKAEKTAQRRQFAEGIGLAAEAGGEPEKPGEAPKPGESAKDNPEEKAKAVTNFQEEMKRLDSMSNEELMKTLFERLGELISSFQGAGGWEALFGQGGPSYSKEEAEKVKVDIEAAEKAAQGKEFPKENRVVEFVARALNLPAKENVQKFLFTLWNTKNFIHEQDKNMFTESNVRVGDVLFFRKEGEHEPHLCAIVSEAGPPMMMKYMTEEGAIQQEEVLASDKFKNEWFGFVKIPESQKPSLPATE